ncbi:MAG: hypothetical protein WA020_07900 [Candidatus Acidiferrales bacterium]
MTRSRLCQVFALTLLLAVALPVIAAPNNSMVLTGNILAKGTFNLVASKSLKGTTLLPGEYKVVASDSQVSFLLKGKVVAQAPIQWKDIQLADTNAVVDESGSIQEIRFKGKGRSVVIM